MTDIDDPSLTRPLADKDVPTVKDEVTLMLDPTATEPLTDIDSPMSWFPRMEILLPVLVAPVIEASEPKDP